MQVITDKELGVKKKPVQVYFDSEMLLLVQSKLGKLKGKISMAEYIRTLVEKDLDLKSKKVRPRKWKSFEWGDEITSDSREIDKIAYGI
jgi:hypothetical protein